MCRLEICGASSARSERLSASRFDARAVGLSMSHSASAAVLASRDETLSIYTCIESEGEGGGHSEGLVAYANTIHTHTGYLSQFHKHSPGKGG